MEEDNTLKIQVTEQGPACPLCKIAQSRNGKLLFVFLFIIIPVLLLLWVYL